MSIVSALRLATTCSWVSALSQPAQDAVQLEKENPQPRILRLVANLGLQRDQPLFEPPGLDKFGGVHCLKPCARRIRGARRAQKGLSDMPWLSRPCSS